MTNTETTKKENEEIEKIVYQIYMKEDLIGGARKIQKLLSSQRQRVLGEVENMRKTITGKSVIENGKPLDKGSLYYEGYNQALSDLTKLIKEGV